MVLVIEGRGKARLLQARDLRGSRNNTKQSLGALVHSFDHFEQAANLRGFRLPGAPGKPVAYDILGYFVSATLGYSGPFF